MVKSWTMIKAKNSSCHIVSCIIEKVVSLESIRFLVWSWSFMRGNESNDKECAQRREVFVNCYEFVDGFEIFISAFLLALQAR